MSPGKENLINEREQTLESSLQRCVRALGILSLCDLDVFVFVYRHVKSLTSAGQIARLLGYETGMIASVLDRLQSQKLIERSRSAQGLRFYRVRDSSDVEQGRCIQELVALSESRAGRLKLARHLKTVSSGSCGGIQPDGVQQAKGIGND